ncbi:gamma-glutamylcyclotransferase family protein [Rubellicoccus peritrichatus]|uniref:Gamma-glutamylcyclotransferase family protein n=1 Tax=Rubellicoccus peritrichatus TaxID=3080537 RepID=A0AAQ3QQ96_9BACT|nr:gamma-glutamylcyclotransferase family protein [Puniceicoccus sp. CR14]WOO40013.1 gamma-glutamylcyclotransferase family protein [Puniceicoccus sp. CR14]
MGNRENHDIDGKSSQEAIRVFVYGTLKPGGHYWDRFCEGKVTDATEAKVRGKLYDLPVGYPAMTESTNEWCYGHVLTLKNQSALDGLDYLEGYIPGRKESENEYQRITVEAFNKLSEPLGKVWCYVMLSDIIYKQHGSFIPSGVWPLKQHENH